MLPFATRLPMAALPEPPMPAVLTDPERPVTAENVATEATCLSRVLSGGELVEDIIAAWDRTQQAIELGDKAALRSLHVQAKRHDRDIDRASLRRDLAKYARFFPEPSSIDPKRIEPELVEVGAHRSLEGQLFRLLRSYWSMPFSKGYGRRLRFLVMDKHHEAVIGLIGLQSPSADLKCRDQYLGARKADKLAVVNTTLDAYTVGASPTYAPLIGGKLVAGFIHSEKVRQLYWRKYASAQTEIEDRRLPQPLLAVTTTSAFGRSSIYNRLRIGNHLLAKPLGFTRGFGTVHLEGLYPHIVAWLKDHGKHVPAGFGHGPKVRWQNVINALAALGIPRTYLEHGLEREVFIFEFASNLDRVHRLGELPEMLTFDDQAWVDHWKERWCLKRVASRPDWNQFNARSKLEAGLDQFS
ncbi:Druantia anti-phage system protein DruA [Xanthomonas bundabergensis]|uniref:Druantia anti-phage system protein DruA n=1 Tax=Xanthomonas bundabergensis TaxID=3160842 RepID=UPI003512458F